MAWIAVDAGTSVIKAVAFADDGRELAVGRTETEVLRPRLGYSEQDMPGTWNAVVTAVRAVVVRISEPVRGIVTTAQGDGCWLVDETGAPTGNAILWNDGRAADIVSGWHDSGVIEQAFRLSGSVAYSGLPNAILQWLRRNEPDRVSTAKYALTCNGWIFSQLTGEFAADLSDASNPFSNVREETYFQQLLSLYGAEEFARLLPVIRRDQELIAPLSLDAAETLGVPAGTPVIMAPYDIVSTAIGAGSVSPGQACIILGTTICTEMILSSLNLDGSPSGTTIAMGDGQYLRAMPTLAGCESLQWAAEVLNTKDIGGLGDVASSTECDAHSPFFLPYLSPAGERAPFLDPAARGSLHGLSLTHSRAQVTRSIYEGLSFVIRDCLENTCTELPKEIRVCGGGSQSAVWCQMISDVTGVKVIRPGGTETGARGAHIFALALTGSLESLVDGINRFVGSTAEFQPSMHRHNLYGERFSKFKKLRDLSAPQWRVQAGQG